MHRMRQMLILLCLLLSVSFTACSEGKPPQSQSWKEATGVEAYERLWWKAIQDGDFKTAALHLAPTYTLTTPGGIQGRDKALQYFQDLNVTSITIAELQVQPAGADMVVSYVATLQTKSSPAPQRFYMNTVWQQAKRGWMAIAHSEVPARV